MPLALSLTYSYDNATRIKIAQEVGLKRQKAFYEFWTRRYPKEQGYTVVMFHKRSKGDPQPDIIILKNEAPYMVVEIKNYSEKGYMMQPTLNKVIKRLTQYSCYRLLIVSTEANLRIRKMVSKNSKVYYYYTDSCHTKKLLKRHGIEVMVMDRQDKLSKEKLNSIIKGELCGWEEEPEPSNYEVLCYDKESGKGRHIISKKKDYAYSRNTF